MRIPSSPWTDLRASPTSLMPLRRSLKSSWSFPLRRPPCARSAAQLWFRIHLGRILEVEDFRDVFLFHAEMLDESASEVVDPARAINFRCAHQRNAVQQQLRAAPPSTVCRRLVRPHQCRSKSTSSAKESPGRREMARPLADILEDLGNFALGFVRLYQAYFVELRLRLVQHGSSSGFSAWG